ncbi:Chitin synthase, class 2 [Allomyces javanicus]|nr:Chitin synthase, class 2 [Allomyces javanicus]
MSYQQQPMRQPSARSAGPGGYNQYPPQQQQGGFYPQQQAPPQQHGVTFGGATTISSATSTSYEMQSNYAASTSGMPMSPAAPASYYSPAQGPSRVKTIKRAVAVRDGKLVVDLEVSPELVDPTKVKYTTGEEFTKLRYTAATCDPNHFAKQGYQLRQSLYGRKTELVVTMYNEDSILFTRTMQAINKNIQHMCNKKTGPFAGEDGWQKIVVCIVSDGRQKINKDVLTVLSTMGCYQEGVCVPKFMNKDTEAHIFEFTTQVAVTDKMEVKTHRDGGVVPVQILFCLKEKNAKKINSHRWFFNAFGPVINPGVCVLVDVGTKPRREAIYRLWRQFDTNPQVGGACGEIAVEYDSLFHLIKPIIAAQNFEYKMSNILDKPLEAWFGYISVLPGAFSAYRYRALQGRPLEQYFKGEKLHDSGDVFAANMYLAEDRILCFELVAKKNEGWILSYEKDSQAITDVPDNFPEFISQRRRWLNGSTFALLYALGNAGQIYTSGQSFLRMIVFTIEYLYMAISFVFSYFSLANFYLAYHFARISLVDDFNQSLNDENFALHPEITKWGVPKSETARTILSSILSVFRSIYILSLCTTFIAALGNRPQAAKYIYLFAINLFAAVTILMFYMIIVSLAADLPSLKEGMQDPFHSEAGKRFLQTSIALGSTYGMYIVSSVLYREPWHMITCFLQYLLLLPCYVNVLQIYAYCNISDVTWGTKGDNGSGGGKGVTVKKGEDGQEVADLELPSQHPADVSLAYQHRMQALTDLKRTLEAGGTKSGSTLSSEDYFKQFRTIWLLIWIIFNGGLVAILIAPSAIGVENGSSLRKTYLQYLFIAVAALSAFRFIGSCGYLVSRGLCAPFKSRGNAR